MKKQVLMMDKKDNVAIVIREVEPGELVTVEEIGASFTAQEKIPCSHKVAIADIEERTPILRYGEPIGYATRKIRQGEWVHVHNLDAYKIM